MNGWISHQSPHEKLFQHIEKACRPNKSGMPSLKNQSLKNLIRREAAH